MRRASWLLIAVTILGVGWYLLPARSDRSVGRFPELKPDLVPPTGYAWTFRDGPDFYTWVLAEPADVGKRPRSVVGIYVGHYPNPSKTAGAEGRVAGRVCNRDVTWLIERSEVATDPWVRWDVVIEYEHGAGFTPVRLHVWVCGPSEDVVAGLANQLAGLTFSDRPQ